MRYQRTIKRIVSTKGVGLHSGGEVNMKIVPAPEDTGVVFIRRDIGCKGMSANISSVVDTRLSTNLRSNGIEVKTVEHLLASLSGLGLDNIYVELDGPEVPIMDGSALLFIDMIIEAGIEIQSKKIPYLKITKPIIIKNGSSHIGIFPYEGRRVSCSIQYDHPMLGFQSMGIDITEENFVQEIAPAKTFGFLKDVEMMRANGLAIGGSLENAIVLDEDGIINTNMVTFTDEFVRHKILDIMGDLSIVGIPIYGHIVADRPGHSANIRLVEEIYRNMDSWEILTEPEREKEYSLFKLLNV